MKHYEKLIRRLRQHALPDPHDEREVLHAPLLVEAANALEELEKEIEELTHDVGQLLNGLSSERKQKWQEKKR